MLENNVFVSIKEGELVDFQFLAIARQAAWSMLQVTTLWVKGMVSMYMSSKANSGVLGIVAG